MNQPPAPSPGATFQRPCNLSSIRPSLQALLAKALANDEQLTPNQAELYGQLCEGWQFYRASQPAHMRQQIDELVDAIGRLRVVA